MEVRGEEAEHQIPVAADMTQMFENQGPHQIPADQ